MLCLGVFSIVPSKSDPNLGARCPSYFLSGPNSFQYCDAVVFEGWIFRARVRITSPIWASIHPVWRRCSSFPYREVCAVLGPCQTRDRGSDSRSSLDPHSKDLHPQAVEHARLTWFWVLLPEQKDLVGRDETLHLIILQRNIPSSKRKPTWVPD